MSILSRVRVTSQSSTSSKAPIPSSPLASSNNFSDSSARLSVGAIAKIFIKMRHLQRQSKQPYTILCDSGLEPLTHPRAQQATFHNSKESITRTAVAHKDTYICAGNGGVDAVRLLRVTRSFLVEQANMLGANTLVDERWGSFYFLQLDVSVSVDNRPHTEIWLCRWSYVINQPKNRPRGQYKVSVRFPLLSSLSMAYKVPFPSGALHCICRIGQLSRYTPSSCHGQHTGDSRANDRH